MFSLKIYKIEVRYMMLKMRIPFFTDVLKRVARGRLRRIMRGYRFLKEKGQLDLIPVVLDELTNTRFSEIDRTASRLFFGAGTAQAELVMRQYLLVRIGSIGLNKALLYSLGAKGQPVIYPMPQLWQQVVAKHGFPVARVRCSLAWAAYVGLFWGYGILSIIKTWYDSLSELVQCRSLALGSYVYFLGLTLGNLPQPSQDGRSHDIVTWYAQWNEKTAGFVALKHGVANAKACSVGGIPVVFGSHPIPPLGTLLGVAQFSGWAFVAIVCSALDLLRGRWWHSLLLAESANAARTRFQLPEKLAQDYMFHNSGWIYRPLWTYEAEKKGSRILFYFYSTNCEVFKRNDDYPVQTGSWQAMSWPLYLVWDEYQADFVRRAVGEAAHIKIVGSIWLQSSSVETPDLPAGSVAVFDVQPFRSSRYQILGMSQEYYTPKEANSFLLDVYTVITECKAVMVYKRKRNIGKLIHPKHEYLVKTLAKADNVVSIEPDISAIRVIESCFAVISMPFTSTALLGKELGKPTIYYDSYGVVQKDDRAAHGIQVLCGKDELRVWLANLIKLDANFLMR